MVAGAAILLGIVRIALDRHADLFSPRGAAVHSPVREFVTTTGQRAEFKLADGTRIVLAPESRLAVAAGYDSLGRIVTLDGEAYFDVVHEGARPFTVRVGNALIRDVGTRFDVRSFRSDSAVRIIVTEGKVLLARHDIVDDPGVQLVAGDLGRLSASGTLSTASRVDTTRFVAWTRGALIFDHTPVRDAFAELARWYDVDIRLADSTFEHRTLTATLPDLSRSAVLDVVALSLDAHIVRQGRAVFFYPRTTGAKR